MNMKYHPTKTAAPSWTFTGRKDEKSTVVSPGPGRYEHQHQLSQTTNKFGHGVSRGRNLDGHLEGTPGPGSYEAREGFDHTQGLIMMPVLSTVKRKEHVVGPGSYSPEKTSKPAGAHYSFRPRPKIYNKTVAANPGPGRYEAINPDKMQNIDAQTKFGLDSKCKDPKRETAPGPGSYEMRLQVLDGKEALFGKAKKGIMDHPHPKLETPGPGQYSQESLLSNRATSLYDRRGLSTPQHIAKGPGPGSYNTAGDILNKYSAAYRVGAGGRSDFTKNLKVSPGPGNYDHKDAPFRNTSSSFGSERRRFGKKPNEQPGPGAYDTVTKKATTPQFTMRPKTMSCGPKQNKNPGPGQYASYSEIGAAPKYGIGTTKKGLEYKIEEVPGAGQYNPQLSKTTPEWGFSQAAKSKEHKTSMDVTGGMSYELPNSFATVAAK